MFRFLVCSGAIFLLQLSLQQTFAQYKDPNEQPSPSQATDAVIREEPMPTTQVVNPPTNIAQNSIEGRRWAFGGSLGLTFGTITLIDIAPSVMYRATQRLLPGVGIQYSYFRQQFNNTAFSTNIYGGRGFVQYLLHPNIFAWGELESLNAELYNIHTGESQREWLTAPLIGGGYRQAINQAGGFNFMLLYNLTYNPNRSIYASPLIIRVGVWF